MSAHGEYVSDSSKLIRSVHDDSGSVVRVLFHEEIYNLISPIWKAIDVGSDLIVLTPPANAISDLLTTLTVEYSAYGWTVGVCLLYAIVKLAKRGVSIGKFTYEKTGKLGTTQFGTSRLGGGTKLLELPVEG